MRRVLPESSGIQHGSRGIVPSSPQPSRHGDLEVTGVRGPRPSCVSALYTTLPTAPGLFSDPFLHFPHNSSCEQRRSCGPGAVLLLCVHGLIYFPQICKVGMTPVPFLHKIWWGLERLRCRWKRCRCPGIGSCRETPWHPPSAQCPQRSCRRRC